MWDTEKIWECLLINRRTYYAQVELKNQNDLIRQEFEDLRYYFAF